MVQGHDHPEGGIYEELKWGFHDHHDGWGEFRPLIDLELRNLGVLGLRNEVQHGGRIGDIIESSETTG